ncbi:MAG: hypothetical protein ABTR07_02785, partial [Candidatus Competibacter denitrificans]
MNTIFANGAIAAHLDQPLWTPDPSWSVTTRMAAFIDYARRKMGLPLPSYAELHAWSIDQPEAFWCGIR